jgi:hypothetical protein
LFTALSRKTRLSVEYRSAYGVDVGTVTVVIFAPGGSSNSEAASEEENFVISKLVESPTVWTKPRTPWLVEQIVLFPLVPGVTRSMQFMEKPLSDMVEVET